MPETTTPGAPQTFGTFTCCFCGRTFDREWSCEEAKAECAALYGKDQVTETECCDDCWKERGLDHPENFGGTD